MATVGVVAVRPGRAVACCLVAARDFRSGKVFEFIAVRVLVLVFATRGLTVVLDVVACLVVVPVRPVVRETVFFVAVERWDFCVLCAFVRTLDAKDVPPKVFERLRASDTRPVAAKESMQNTPSTKRIKNFFISVKTC